MTNHEHADGMRGVHRVAEARGGTRSPAISAQWCRPPPLGHVPCGRMARATYVPINGQVLAWAMEHAGVDDVELAERCGTSPDVVEDWRQGDLEPTKTQCRQLVARLRRPSSIYFLAEPPDDDPVIRAFRSPPGAKGERHLTDAELRAIQTAERIQKVAKWVRERRGDDPIAIPRFTSTPNRLAAELKTAHEFLGWDVSDQVDAKSTSEVAKLLRARLERRRSSGLAVLDEGGRLSRVLASRRRGARDRRQFRLHHRGADLLLHARVRAPRARHRLDLRARPRLARGAPV